MADLTELIVRLDGEIAPHVAKPPGVQLAEKLRFRTAVPVFWTLNVTEVAVLTLALLVPLSGVTLTAGVPAVVATVIDALAVTGGLWPWTDAVRVRLPDWLG